MRAAVYYGNHQLKIEDVPEPTARAGQVSLLIAGLLPAWPSMAVTLERMLPVT
jgi:hypothetical protein